MEDVLLDHAMNKFSWELCKCSSICKMGTTNILLGLLRPRVADRACPKFAESSSYSLLDVAGVSKDSRSVPKDHNGLPRLRGS